mmetsp:Transcript_84329/g.273003  ORF Transcript_84329/g.273003 Transcript_84329/m.273003 type:complete len:211 (-) Transcript_84329:165-797(-)
MPLLLHALLKVGQEPAPGREGQGAEEHEVGEDAHCPHVHGRAVGHAAVADAEAAAVHGLEELRGHERGGAHQRPPLRLKERLPPAGLHAAAREAKVHQFDQLLALVRVDHILGLDIPVGDAPAMQVGQPRADLQQDGLRLPLAVRRGLRKGGRDLAARGQLHDDVQARRAHEGLQRADDIRVPALQCDLHLQLHLQELLRHQDAAALRVQ